MGTKEGVYQWEIIGVVKNSKYTGLREGPVRMIYVPARPGPWASRTVVHLRTSGDAAALASALRQKVQDLDKTAAIFDRPRNPTWRSRPDDDACKRAAGLSTALRKDERSDLGVLHLSPRPCSWQAWRLW